MKRHLDTELRELKELLARMAGYVERGIDSAISGLISRDLSRIRAVFEIEKHINRAQIDVDEACVRLLALHQPLANDLRLIVAMIKINTDLERMGDQAVNIAMNSREYLKSAPLKPLIDLPILFKECKIMVKDALDSFVKQDVALARQVLLRDSKVDQLKETILTDVIKLLEKEPEKMEQGLSLIFIARNLERLGDHASNIAEDVIFAVSGKDVRHSLLKVN